MKDLNFINKRPLLSKGQEVAVISTYLTEQMIVRDFSVVRLSPTNYEEKIMERNIEVVFIDSSIYEKDHTWYKFETKTIIDLIRKLDVNIIIVNNDDTKQYVDDEYFHINIYQNNKDIDLNHNILSIPVVLNENLFNPINDNPKLDVLYFHIGKLIRNQYIQKLHVKFNPKREEIVNDVLTRKVIIELIHKIKNTKVLYIYFEENLPEFFIRIVEKIAALQNTIVVLDSNYSTEYDLSINTKNEESNIDYLRTFCQKGIFREKKLITNHRKIFLNNTLMQYETLDKIIQGNTNKKDIGVSVITSTKRKWTLTEYIERLNNQSIVKLDVTLLTHGFELDSQEKDEYQKQAKFNINFLAQSSNVSFGDCLNECISLTTKEYFTKIDDDDYYYENYLIDSWIAKQYSNADIVGKHAQFVYLESNEMVLQRFERQQYKYTEYVAGATIFCKTDFIKQYLFSDLPKAVDSDLLRRVREDKGRLYCLHPYEFCIFRANDKSEHTWQIEDTRLLKSAKIHFIGNPKDTIQV